MLFYNLIYKVDSLKLNWFIANLMWIGFMIMTELSQIIFESTVHTLFCADTIQTVIAIKTLNYNKYQNTPSKLLTFSIIVVATPWQYIT